MHAHFGRWALRPDSGPVGPVRPVGERLRRSGSPSPDPGEGAGSEATRQRAQKRRSEGPSSTRDRTNRTTRRGYPVGHSVACSAFVHRKVGERRSHDGPCHVATLRTPVRRSSRGASQLWLIAYSTSRLARLLRLERRNGPVRRGLTIDDSGRRKTGTLSIAPLRTVCTLSLRCDRSAPRRGIGSGRCAVWRGGWLPALPEIGRLLAGQTLDSMNVAEWRTGQRLTGWKGRSLT